MSDSLRHTIKVRGQLQRSMPPTLGRVHQDIRLFHVLQTSGKGATEGDTSPSDQTSRPMRRSGLSDHCRVVEVQERDRPTDRGGSNRRVWDCGSPLYDSYELAALNHLLERHMMVLPPSCGSTRMTAVVPSGKVGRGNGKGRAEAAGMFFFTTTSLARSLGRRLWQRVTARGSNTKDDEEDDDKEKSNHRKVFGFRFYALSCGSSSRFGD